MNEIEPKFTHEDRKAVARVNAAPVLNGDGKNRVMRLVREGYDPIQLNVEYVDSNLAIGHSFDLRAKEEYRILIDANEDFNRPSKFEKNVKEQSMMVPAAFGVAFLSWVVTTLTYLFFNPFAPLISTAAFMLVPVALVFAIVYFGVIPKKKLSIEGTVEYGTTISAHVIKNLKNVLTKSDNPKLITAVVRRKLMSVEETGGDEEAVDEFTNWLSYFVTIFELQPDFDPEHVPILKRDAKTVMKAVEANHKLRKEAETKLAITNNHLDATADKFRQDFIKSQLDEDSTNVLEIAMERLKADRQFDSDFRDI